MDEEKPNIPPTANQRYTLDKSGPCEVIVIPDSDEEPDVPQETAKNTADSESDDDENERRTDSSMKRKNRGGPSRKIRRVSSMDSLYEEQSDIHKARSTIRPAKSANSLQNPAQSSTSRANALRRANSNVPSSSALLRTAPPTTPLASQLKPKRQDPTKAARELLINQQRQLEEAKKKLTDAASRKPKTSEPKLTSRTAPSRDERAPKRLRINPSTATGTNANNFSNETPQPESPNIEESPNPPNQPSVVQVSIAAANSKDMAQLTAGANKQVSSSTRKLEPTTVPTRSDGASVVASINSFKLGTRKLFIKFRPRRFDFPQSEGLAMYSPFAYLMDQMGVAKDSVCATCGDFHQLDFTCQRCELKFHKSCINPQSEMYCRACQFVARGPDSEQEKPTDLWKKLKKELSEGNPIDMVLTPSLFVKYLQMNSTDWLICFKCKKYRIVPQESLSECIKAPFSCADAYWSKGKKDPSCSDAVPSTDVQLLEKVWKRVHQRVPHRLKLFLRFGAKNADLFNSRTPVAQPSISQPSTKLSSRTALNSGIQSTAVVRTPVVPQNKVVPPGINRNGVVSRPLGTSTARIHQQMQRIQRTVAPVRAIAESIANTLHHVPARNSTPATAPVNVPVTAPVQAQRELIRNQPPPVPQPQRVVRQPAPISVTVSQALPLPRSTLSNANQQSVTPQSRNVQYQPVPTRAPSHVVVRNNGIGAANTGNLIHVNTQQQQQQRAVTNTQITSTVSNVNLQTVTQQSRKVQYQPVPPQARSQIVGRNNGIGPGNTGSLVHVNRQQQQHQQQRAVPNAQIISKVQGPSSAQIANKQLPLSSGQIGKKATPLSNAQAINPATRPSTETQVQSQVQASTGQSTSGKVSVEKFRADVCNMIGQQSAPGELEDTLVDMVQAEDKELMKLYEGFGQFETLFMRQAKRLAAKKLENSKKNTSANEPEVEEVPVQNTQAQPKLNVQTVAQNTTPVPAASASNSTLVDRMNFQKRFRDQRIGQMMQEINAKQNMIREMENVNLQEVHFLHVEQVQRCRAICQRQNQELVHLMANTPGFQGVRRVSQPQSLPQQFVSQPQQRPG